MKYVITSMDGRAAASRGGECDQTCIVEGNVKDKNEALYIAALLKIADGSIDIDGEYNSEDIPQLEKIYLEDWCGDNENDPDYIEHKEWLEEIKQNPIEWLNENNLEGIDGGSCWITRVKCNGKNLFREE